MAPTEFINITDPSLKLLSDEAAKYINDLIWHVKVLGFSSPNIVLKLSFFTSHSNSRFTRNQQFSNVFAKITLVTRRDVRPAL